MGDSHQSRRASAVFKQEGARGVWLRAVARVYRAARADRWYRRLRFTSVDWHTAAIDGTCEVPIEFRWLTPGDVDAYVQSRSAQMAASDPTDALKRLALGHRCSTAWSDGRIVSSAWGVPGRACIDELQLCFDLASDEIYWYDSYTDPALRGRNVSGARSVPTRQESMREGLRYACATISPENRASIRASTKVGWEMRGSIGYVQMLGRRLDFVFLRRRRPRLAVRPIPRHHELVTRVTPAAVPAPVEDEAKGPPEPALRA